MFSRFCSPHREMRVEQVRARHKLNEIAARRYVDEVDKARTRRLQGMFGADWRDASRYDLVVNLGHMSVATAKQLIVGAAHAPDYQMTQASKQAFENFALASRVRATLALAEDLSQVRVEVKVNEGDIFVVGLCRNGLPQGKSSPTLKRFRASTCRPTSRRCRPASE